MGLPQGSVIAPLLFNILIMDLPNIMTKNITLVQYADDICIWMKVNLKKNTNKRTANYIRGIYQKELDKISQYMSENGLVLSSEKTHMMLFNSGANPDNIPHFVIDGVHIQYKQSVKFLGVFLTCKLTWNVHLEHILTKARKSLNFLVIISKQHRGQDTTTLIHLATSLIRSQLSYAQEVFFSAPSYLLKKLQSVDCKAYRLALGLPFHASTLGSYGEAGVLPLDSYRNLAAAKYLIRSTAVNNSHSDEIELRSDSDFPKRGQKISSLKTIATYTADLLNESGVCPKEVSKRQFVSPIPVWEQEKATFDIQYTDVTKSENSNILSLDARFHLKQKYPNHLKVFTDGSKLDNNQGGAGFVIPALSITKSFNIGINRSIFTAELIAILMALVYLTSLPVIPFQILVCVDSKSVLHALKSTDPKVRGEILFEINHLIHLAIVRGSDICFCWIPSHCGILYNEWADRAAKKGAKQLQESESVNIPLSVQESYSLLERQTWSDFKNMYKEDGLGIFTSSFRDGLLKIQYAWTYNNKSILYSRNVISLMFRLKLNSFKTKFVKTVKCICGADITNYHLIFDCYVLKPLLPNFQEKSLQDVFSNHKLLLQIAQTLLNSPVGLFL